MKKIWVILISIFLLILLLGGYNFVSRKLVEREYPMVWKVNLNGLIEIPMFDNETSANENGTGLSVVGKEYLYCDQLGKNATVKEISHHNVPFLDGAWSYHYVVECENTYWIYRAGDAGPWQDFWGPFEKP